MDDRGRHLDKSTFFLSRTLTPVDTGGVARCSDGVVGGVVDLRSSNEEVKDVVAVDMIG
jgi:hypothetical protein